MHSLDSVVAEHRRRFLDRTAHVQPTLEQWRAWSDPSKMPERHRQFRLPGLDDKSIRRGFRRRRALRAISTAYTCQRRRPGRQSRWAEAELRSMDLFAVDVIPDQVLEESHLSPADRRVLLAVLFYARGREAWTQHMAPIANMARVARSTAHLAIARLVNAGYVGRHENRITADRNGPNCWTLLDARLLAASAELAGRSREDSVLNGDQSLLEHRVQKLRPVKHTHNINTKSREIAARTVRARPPLSGGTSAFGAPPPIDRR